MNQRLIFLIFASLIFNLAIAQEQDSLDIGNKKNQLDYKNSIGINLFLIPYGDIQFDYRKFLIKNKLEYNIKPSIVIIQHSSIQDPEFKFVGYYLSAGINYIFFNHVYTGVFTKFGFPIKSIRPSRVELSPLLGVKWGISKNFFMNFEIGYGLEKYLTKQLIDKKIEQSFTHFQIGLSKKLNFIN